MKKKLMKTAMLIAVVVLASVLVAACQSMQSQSQSIEESLRNVYERYYGDLILEGAQPYTVVSGDTLARISRAKYNNGFYFPVIMLASKDVVIDPDRIEPGMVLTVPDIQKNLDNPRARANIKRFLGEIAKIEDDRNRPQDAQGLRNLANSL